MNERPIYYKLVGHDAVPVSNVEDATWSHSRRRVAKDIIDDAEVLPE